MDLAHDRHARARLRRRERCALAREPGSDDQDVVCWHGECAAAPAGPAGGTARRGRLYKNGPSGRAQRLLDLRERHNAAQHALGGYETWRARSSYLEVDASRAFMDTWLDLLKQVAK